MPRKCIAASCLIKRERPLEINIYKTCDEYAPFLRKRQNPKFQQFKSGDFDFQDKERAGRPKMFQETQLLKKGFTQPN